MTIEEFQNEYYCKFSARKSICNIIIIKTEVFRKSDETLQTTIRYEKNQNEITLIAQKNKETLIDKLKEYKFEQFIKICKLYMMDEYIENPTKSFQEIQETTYKKSKKSKFYFDVK